MIDLRSDTVTQPTPEMRQAMAQAEVGDDVLGEDPTVNRLQEHAAALLKKEAALFVPSGTMANLLAFLAQSRPGDNVVLSAEAHPVHYERANMAALAGLMPVTIPDTLGKLNPEAVSAHIVQVDDAHFSQTALVAIENTTNRGGGACYTPEEVGDLADLCHKHGLSLHCDGARIFNAALAQNIEVSELAEPCDTLCFCLSKGLGAPVGSLLTGSGETIKRAHQYRKMLGGGMRQSGILAAAGLHALEHHIEPLREDHRRAHHFRESLEALGARFPLPSPTNIVYIEIADPHAATAALKEKGVLVLPHGSDRLRAVFHRDIDDTGLDRATEAFIQVLGFR